MIPNTNNTKTCPYSTTNNMPTTSCTVLDTSKATGSTIPPMSTSSIRQLSSHSCTSPSSSQYDSPAIATRIYDETSPTQAQIDIVRYSWERVSEIRHATDDPNVSSSHAFGLAFYDALFELDPTLKPLFTNIFQQARALAGMIAFITRAPNMDTNYNTSCGFDTNNASNAPKRALTIREINARKRKTSKASTFSELVTNTALNDPVTPNDHDIETDPDLFLFRLRELGAKHYFYHVQSHHFVLIGPAVLSALKVRLGKEFLPEVADAWTRVNIDFSY